MAGGASSRMKRSLAAAELDEETLFAAQNWHKSLIPIDDDKRPLLYYLLRNAVEAGIKKAYLITGKENAPFHQFLKRFENEPILKRLATNIAIQHVAPNRSKPSGTADAVQQCMDQFPELKNERFTVCNGDNLYSAQVMRLLRKDREVPFATIAYKGSGLGFDDERLSKFAVMDIDGQGYLQQIIEKPELEEMERYRSDSGEFAISMNIFNFSGGEVFNYLKNCPINPSRDEKELPEAVRTIVMQHPKAVLCYPVSEILPDLTTAEDIKKMNLYL